MSKDEKKGKAGYELSNIIVVFKDEERVKLASLEYGTLLRLKTAEHSYEVALIDPEKGICVIYGTDEDFFVNPVRCSIHGSVVNEGVSSIFSNYIVKGIYLEVVIYNPHELVYLGPIESVDVEPNSPLAKKMIDAINDEAH